MKKIFFISLAMILSLLPLSGQKKTEDALKEEIISACTKVSSIKCDFIQTKNSSLLSEPVISSGIMKYSKPAFLVWSYTEPLSYTFTMNGQKITVEKDGKLESFDARQNRLVREISRLIVSNIEGSALSDKMFRTSLTQSGEEVTARMVPLNKDMKKMWSEFVLHYSTKSYTVKSFELHEANGDTTIITFKNCHYGFAE